MASHTVGIQQLLNAEKKATEKVMEAKKRKAQRLKAAKREADAEITSYKNEREKNYKEYEARIFGSRSDMEINIQNVKEQKFHQIAENVKKNRGAAVDSILELVKDITVELHENIKL